MANVTASFMAPVVDPSHGPADQAQISWTLNGAAAAVVLVSMAGPGPFSADFNAGNPSVTLNPGDIVGCSGQAQNSAAGLVGPADAPVPPTVTIPTPAPSAPGDLVNFTLAVS